MIAESVELVVAALGAGVAAGVSDTAKKAYEKVTSRVGEVLGRDPDEVREQVTESDAARDDLVAALEDAEDDHELVEAARNLLLLTGHVDQHGKFVTHAHDNTGVQIGDGNTMTLHIDNT